MARGGAEMLSRALRRLRKKVAATHKPKAAARKDSGTQTRAPAPDNAETLRSDHLPVGHIDAPSRTLYLRHGERAVPVIALTEGLQHKLQDAIRSNRRIKEAEDAVDEREMLLLEELDDVRIECKSMMQEQWTRARERRLFALERRDVEIVAELDGIQGEVVEMYMDARELFGEVFEGLGDVFARDAEWNAIGGRQRRALPEGHAYHIDDDAIEPKNIRKAFQPFVRPVKKQQVRRKTSIEGPASGSLPTTIYSKTKYSFSEIMPRPSSAETTRSRASRRRQTVHDLRAEVERLENELLRRQSFEHRLLQEYKTARDDVAEAQRQFDDAPERHEEEERRFYTRVAAEDDAGSTTWFDLNLLLDKQRLTRNLIEAEEDYDAAKAKAMTEGVDLGEDERSSGFVSLTSDGYRESKDQAAIRDANPDGFADWMEKTPADAGLGESAGAPEVDEWEARAIETWESVSVLAQGSDRRRIDRWQHMLGH